MSTTRLALPIEIISQIIGHLSDCQILSLYNDIPILASNPLYLPVLKNNYNYYCNDFEMVEKLLAKGFKIAIVVGDNQMLTRILEHPKRHLIYKMKLEHCKITTELLNNNKRVYGMNNLQEIIMYEPLNFNTPEYDFVVKKLKENGFKIEEIIFNLHVDYIYLDAEQRRAFATNGINIYSYGLYQEGHQSSGTVNFSRIDNASLTLN